VKDPPLNFAKKNINNVGPTSINPHVPYRRRQRLRRKLLPISKGFSYMEAFNFKVDTPPKPLPLKIGSMMFVSPTKNRIPAYELSRTRIEWPTWTKKSWQNIVASSAYLTAFPKVREKIIDTALHKLSLRNKMRVGGEKLACLITGSVRFNRTLVALDLSSCSLNSDATEIVCRCLVSSHSVKTLNLSNNFIHAEGCKSISSLLRKNKIIKSLHLRDARLTDMGNNFSGIQSLAVGLRLNTTVEILDVATNGLQRKGAMMLIHVLRFNWRLELINLEDNHLCNDDAITLCGLIQQAEVSMEDYRNSIKLAPEVAERTFHLGDVENQPSLLLQNTRWEQTSAVNEDTCTKIELAGVKLTKARMLRAHQQKLLEAARFRLPRKDPPPYIAPPSSSAWEVLSRLRPGLGQRVAQYLTSTHEIRVPENYADADWHLTEEEKVEKARLKARENAGLVNSSKI
jgi:hypothetical protein